MVVTTPPPASEYEKEIRALYRERNERTFVKPEKTHLPIRRLVDFLALIFLISAVSITASIKIYNWLYPSGEQLALYSSPHSTVAQAELADDFIVQLSGSVATVFTERSVKANSSAVDQSYLMSEALGQALVLSSDGWLVTTQAVVSEIKGNYVVVPADGRAYKVTAVALDPVAPLAYIKIDSRNLTATPFATSEEISTNAPVVAIIGETQGSSRSWYLRYLANINARTPLGSRTDLSVSSESMPDRLILDQTLPTGSKGAPIMNLQGKVVGLVADYGGLLRGVLPMWNMSPVIESLFSQKKVSRPSIGLTYVQSGWLLRTESSGAAGAILLPGTKRAAVVSKSPAAAAGLKEGDKIITIENESMGLGSFSLLLQRYRPGSTIELIVERAGKEQKIKVTLGSVEGESYDSTAQK